MHFDFRRLVVLVAALAVYALLSPLLGLPGKLAVLVVSIALVGAFTTSGFNKFLHRAVQQREHRELLFYFVAPFAAFAAGDVFMFFASIGGVPSFIRVGFGILIFFAIITWLTFKIFPAKVAPRMP